MIADNIMHEPVSIKRYTKPKQTFTMKQFFITMFANNEGTSHKRVLGTIGFLSLVVYLFICEPEVKPEIISAVEYVTMATVFGTVIEKFTNKKPEDKG